MVSGPMEHWIVAGEIAWALDVEMPGISSTNGETEGELDCGLVRADEYFFLQYSKVV